MKQCPECNEVFDNQKAFCDMDGSELVKLTDSPRAISQTNAPAGTTSCLGDRRDWRTHRHHRLCAAVHCFSRAEP
jgi:hypothetical protein